MKRITTHKLKKELHQTLQPNIPIDDEHMAQTIRIASSMISTLKKRSCLTTISLLFDQFRFIGWKLWGVAGISLLLLAIIMNSLYGQFFWENPQTLFRFLLCLSILVAMSTVPIIYRSVRYKMHEIEAATYFSSIKILLAKLLIIAIGDILILVGTIAILVTKMHLSLQQASSLICLPFLLICCLILHLLGRLPSRLFLISSMLSCFILLIASVLIPSKVCISLTEALVNNRFVIFGLTTIWGIRQYYFLRKKCHFAQLQIG